MEIPTLQPGNILEHERFGVVDAAAENRLYGVAIYNMQNTISALLVEDVFNPADVATNMHDDLQSTGLDTLVQTAIRQEIEWSYVGTSVLKAYGMERPDDEIISENPWQGPIFAPMPEDFGNDMLEQVANMDMDFNKLAKMHDVFKATKLPKIIQGIKDLNLYTPESTTNAVDVIFELVEEAIFNPDYTLPIEEDESIYMLCYLPPTARRMVKSAMMANQLMVRMDKNLGELSDPYDMQMRGAFMDVLRAEALSGQDWDQLGTRFGVTEKTRQKAAFLEADKLDGLATIQQLEDADKGSKVVTSFTQASKELHSKVEDVCLNDPAVIFANTDIGHAFNRFAYLDLDAVVRGGIVYDFSAGVELSRPIKNGRRAVVFEDDNKQAERWKELVNRYSQFVTQDSDRYIKTQDVMQRIDDESVGLYLIDINNDENDTAGITLADKLLRKKLSNYNLAEEDEKPLPVKIIVWSTSPTHVGQASQHFRSLFDGPSKLENIDGVSYRLEGSRAERAGTNITVVVKYKLPDRDDFATRRRSY